MSGCNWRKLEADGRVMTCAESAGPEQPLSHCSPDWHDSGMVIWHKSDPLAWDATCPDCDGQGILGIDLGEDWGDCGRCGAMGTVDTIPTRLVGVGSVVEHQHDVQGVFSLVAGIREGRTGRIADLVSVNAAHHAVLLDQIGPDGPWTLIRAVPPAAHTAGITPRWPLPATDGLAATDGPHERLRAVDDDEER